MRHRLGPWRGFILLTTFHLSVSLAYISIFARFFNHRPVIIPLHGALVAGLIMATTLFLGLLVSFRAFRTWRPAQCVVGLVPAAVASFLACLCALDAVANYAWGANITWPILFEYLIPDWVNLIAALPIHPAWVHAPLGIMAAVVFLFYLGVSKRLLAGLEELFLPTRPFSLFRDRRRSLFSAIGIGAAALGYTILVVIALWSSQPFWSTEPITGFFKSPSLAADDPYRAEVVFRDRDARAQYPLHVPVEPKNVILILVDSLRADHMQVYGYKRPTTPFLARLADSGRLRKVRFATSTCCDTACGVLSTMASKGYADIATYNFKLYDLLHDLGYRTYFVLSGDHTFFYSECRAALGNDMDLFFDGFSSHQYPVSDDRLVLDGLDQVPDYAGAPAFFYLFLSAPHPVGVRDPQYERYRPARLDTRGMVAVWTGVRNLEAMINRYDNSVLQADAALEQIFAKLDRKGYLADAVAVILADHGLGLGERGNYSHTIYLYQEDINIPLLIYDDTNTVYANLEFATQTDVAPTIVDRLGLPIPACWQGHSLLRDNTRQFSFHTTTRPSEVWRAVIYRTDDKLYKYLEFRKAGLPPEREELYELVADPREAQNLIARADNGLIRLVKEKLAAAFKVPNN